MFLLISLDTFVSCSLVEELSLTVVIILSRSLLSLLANFVSLMVKHSHLVSALLSLALRLELSPDVAVDLSM